MGILSTTRISNNHTHVSLPSTINVHEHKAPTDESVKLMEEMHDKALKNIIAKVKVEDNLVSGYVFLISQPTNMFEYKLVFKFKINGQEFTVEKEVDRREFAMDEEFRYIESQLQDKAKALLLWYSLKKFTQVAYEDITKSKLPDYLIK